MIKRFLTNQIRPGLVLVFSIVLCGMAYHFLDENIAFYLFLFLTLVVYLLVSHQIQKSSEATENNQEKWVNVFNKKFSDVQNTCGAVLVNQHINPLQPIYPFGGSIISYDMGLILIDFILDKKPQLIVECGSGMSTIISGYMLKKIRQGKVISLDHEEKFANITRRNLAKHGLEEHAEVITAPLEKINIDGVEYSWYDDKFLQHIEHLDMLFVDGPPRNNKELTRYPALPLLYSKLRKGGIVIMDDANRWMEREIADQWKKKFSFSDHYYLDTLKGTTIFVK